MSWAYRFEERALKELKKLGPQTQREIVGYLEERLSGNIDPRILGKPLHGDLAGLWRYRIADYRVICSLNEGVMLILVLKVGHRRNVYN